MAFNSSQSPNVLCLVSFPSVREISYSTNYELIITVCVVTALLAPMAVAGNAFILAAIWRNPSLRTPSYVLLAGLAVTDFGTGLISQPFFIFNQVAAITGDKLMHCITDNIAGTVSYYFSSLTVLVMTLIAVERWLHMSRRSLLTVRRVIILYIFSAVSLVLILGAFFCRLYVWFIYKLFFMLETLYYFGGALCIIATAFAYFKVFQIIRRHYNQVHTNSNAIDMQKFKKSVFTILYILAIFVLSYVPYLCCFLVTRLSQRLGTKSAYAAVNVSKAMVFSSSAFNPLLYYLRIKAIRDDIRIIVRKLFCKQNQEES